MYLVVKFLGMIHALIIEWSSCFPIFSIVNFYEISEFFQLFDDIYQYMAYVTGHRVNFTSVGSI